MAVNSGPVRRCVDLPSSMGLTADKACLDKWRSVTYTVMTVSRTRPTTLQQHTVSQIIVVVLCINIRLRCRHGHSSCSRGSRIAARQHCLSCLAYSLQIATLQAACCSIARHKQRLCPVACCLWQLAQVRACGVCWPACCCCCHRLGCAGLWRPSSLCSSLLFWPASLLLGALRVCAILCGLGLPAPCTLMTLATASAA